MIEFADQVERIFVQRLVVDAGFRNIKIEDGGQNVETGNKEKGHLANAVDAGINEGEIDSRSFCATLG